MPRMGRAGTPATNVRGATGPLTTLPAPTKDSAPIVTPARMVVLAPTKAPAPIVTGAAMNQEVLLQRVVRVAHVHVDHHHTLGQRHLVFEMDRLGQVEQAFVADEALAADAEAREPAAVQQVEEAQVVQDRAAANRAPSKRR